MRKGWRKTLGPMLRRGSMDARSHSIPPDTEQRQRKAVTSSSGSWQTPPAPSHRAPRPAHSQITAAHGTGSGQGTVSALIFLPGAQNTQTQTGTSYRTTDHALHARVARTRKDAGLVTDWRRLSRQLNTTEHPGLALSTHDARGKTG